MKKNFLNYAIASIRKNGDYTKEKLEEIAYGLEAIYLTVTKMIILFGMAAILNVVKEFVLLLIFYNIIRVNAFGLHASKSIYCLISSTLLFIGGTYLCKNIKIPFKIMFIVAIICVMCLFKYAPADTEKRPIINIKKRKRFRLLSTLSGIIYVILIILFRNYSIVNYLWLGLVEAVIMILPVTYKIFNLPYDNYKRYKVGVY